MKDYNPKNTLKLNPEQQAIKDFRQAEYQRKYAIKSEDKVNQGEPSPKGQFDIELQGLARQLVERASDLTNKKQKGDIDNYDYAAKMAIIERSVNELGIFANAVKTATANYNKNLQEGTLSYGMDQYDEGVLQGLDQGTVTLGLDKDGRAVLNGKGMNPLEGEFDVNIYDVNNIPAAVPKIKPINLTLDPVAKELGLDENGMPLLKVDKYGNKMYDSGPYEDHRLEVLDFSQNALEAMGQNGIRSYLADHMQMPQSQVKMLMEEQSYTDPQGVEWDNRGTAEAFESMHEYIGNKYNRQRKPHPETVTKLAKQSAQKIAQEKGIRPEDITATEILGIESNPPVQQAAVPEVDFDTAIGLNAPASEEAVAVEETTPEGAVDVDELIKKYS